MNINKILEVLKKPGIYEKGTERIWTNQYIAKNMLKAHFDDSNDAASYKGSKIDNIVKLILEKTKSENIDSIIDFGCGPGRYVSKFADLGVSATGVDFSENSIRYARNANRDRVICDFIHADYSKPIEFNRKHDAALLISEDYGVLSTDSRYKLLANINRSLKEGGYFFFDIPSHSAYDITKGKSHNKWSVSEKGFYRPHPYLLIEDTYFYDKERVSCKSILVIDNEIQIYRIYQTYFTPDKITEELNDCGFEILEKLGNLEGDIYRESGKSLGIVCRKK